MSQTSQNAHNITILNTHEIKLTVLVSSFLSTIFIVRGFPEVGTQVNAGNSNATRLSRLETSGVD